MAGVSNAALLQAINKVAETQGRMEQRMANVEEQVRFINGKVANLVEDKIRRDEREKVLAAQPQPAQIQYTEKDVVQP